MIPLLFALIISSAVAQVLWAFRRKGGILEYPFLVSWVILFFVATQTFVVWQENLTDEYPIVRLLLMVFICQSAGFVGYNWSNVHPPKVVETCELRYLRLFAAASVLFGGFFCFKLMTLPEEMRTSTQWSGATVAYLFLSKPLFFGGMVAFSIALQTKDRFMMGIAGVNFLISLSAVLIGGRRGPMIELVLSVSTVLFFVKGWIVPRSIALAVIPLGVIFVNGAAIYRTNVYHGQLYGSQLSWTEVPARIAFGFSKVAERADECILPTEVYEIRNAISYMDTISEQSNYDFGTGLWDLMVHRYVPGQLVGRDLKESLKIGIIETTVSRSTHRSILGTTMTGFTDAFQAFGYFGAIYFFFSAMILRRFWESASSGNLTSQIAYGVLIRDGLEAVTHHSCYVFAGIVVIWAFVTIPIGFLRRMSSKNAVSTKAPLERMIAGLPARGNWARR
jgi:hypothetical protein